jgi:hypothetical protein
MLTLQTAYMTGEQKQKWHIQKQNEHCKQQGARVALHETSETLEQLEQSVGDDRK